jgi:hypothetical protein
METDIKEFSYYEDSEGNLDKLDSVVTSVIDQFAQRAQFGKQKYGTDLDRKDLTTLDWIEHAKQELMDGILYLEKLKQELSVKK